MTRKLWADTALTTVAMLVRAACQAATFLILARVFDPAPYGQFVALVCVGVLLAPLVTAGIEYVTVGMIATRRGSTAECLGTGLIVLGVLSPLVVVAGFLYAKTALATVVDEWSSVLFLISEIVLVPALELSWRAYQANERMGVVALLRASPAALKLIGATLLAVGPVGPSISNWAGVYAAASTLGMALGIYMAWRDFGVGQVSARRVFRSMREGWPFAIYSIAERTTNDVDKLLLASLAGPREAGLFAAAYRLVEVFVMPVMAGLMTMNAAIFRAGAAHGPALARLLRKLVVGVTTYGLCACVIILAGKEAAVELLGGAYAQSAEPLAALAVLPLCYGLRVLFGFALASIGRQLTRMIVQCAAAVTSIITCLIAIPLFGLLGAAYATIITEVFTIVTLCALLWAPLRNQRDNAPPKSG